jgi:glycerol-3-phosphate acyltransferase PlsX
MDKVTICVDAMGGDNAPGVVLEGVEAALRADEDLEVILVGPQDVVETFADGHDRCTAAFASEVIEMGEHPANAVRSKKDSSIVVGCNLVKEGKGDGFFSAGSTGAVLAGGVLKIGRIKGVKRPALCTIIPSPVRPVVMADVGANADCKPEYLVQFAHMATIYAEKIIGIDNPNVALLNIGSEEAKGSQFAQEAFALMKEQVPNFVGNAEGNDIIPANYDVFITDGFTGNMVLKTIEGTAKTLFKSVKGVMMSSTPRKLAGLVLKGGLKELADSISSDTYGGAPLLGVKGACIVGHGSSNATAIKNGVLITAKIARQKVPDLIAEAIAR